LLRNDFKTVHSLAAYIRTCLFKYMYVVLVTELLDLLHHVLEVVGSITGRVMSKTEKLAPISIPCLTHNIEEIYIRTYDI